GPRGTAPSRPPARPPARRACPGSGRRSSRTSPASRHGEEHRHEEDDTLEDEPRPAVGRDVPDLELAALGPELERLAPPVVDGAQRPAVEPRAPPRVGALGEHQHAPRTWLDPGRDRAVGTR